MRVLVTGAAGFIGFHVARRLLTQGIEVIGVDSVNTYYDRKIKYDRLFILEEDRNFSFFRRDLSRENGFYDFDFFDQYQHFDKVIHLAAYAGVRYSIEHPQLYIYNNVSGFLNLLERCKNGGTDHLIYASSASVYGSNDTPFSTSQVTDSPKSVYGVSKKTNELLATAYNTLYDLPCTGLRFFTAYGEWGRPDMAMYKFAKAIMADEEIEVYNHGHMTRCFTYIDDLVEVVCRAMEKVPTEHKIYNVVNPTVVSLEHLISLIEGALGKYAKKKYLGMQMGDIKMVSADITDLRKDFKFQPSTTIQDGVLRFIKWFKEYEGGSNGND